MYICETGILLLALSRYIGDPDVIDHCGLVCDELCPEPSLGRRADNVIISLDLTQPFCPGVMLAAGPPSGFITDIVGCWEKPCGDPAISLHSHTVSLVQWVNCLLLVMRDPGSMLPGLGYQPNHTPVRLSTILFIQSSAGNKNLSYGMKIPCMT